MSRTFVSVASRENLWKATEARHRHREGEFPRSFDGTGLEAVRTGSIRGAAGLGRGEPS